MICSLRDYKGIPEFFELAKKFKNDNNITDEKIESILSSLGCRVSPDRYVRVPAWRWPGDLNHDADLIEEIARIYGFNEINEILICKTNPTVVRFKDFLFLDDESEFFRQLYPIETS